MGPMVKSVRTGPPAKKGSSGKTNRPGFGGMNIGANMARGVRVGPPRR